MSYYTVFMADMPVWDCYPETFDTLEEARRNREERRAKAVPYEKFYIKITTKNGEILSNKLID